MASERAMKAALTNYEAGITAMVSFMEQALNGVFVLFSLIFRLILPAAIKI